MKKNKKGTVTKKKKSTVKTKTPIMKRPIVKFLIVFLILMVLAYLFLDTLLTIFLGVGILIIMGMAYAFEKSKNNPKKKKKLRIFLIIILSLGILIMLAGIAFIVYVVLNAPEFNEEQLNTTEPTRIFDINGNVVEELGTEMREKVSYDELPEVLIDAIIATEDSRFFQHNGLDTSRFLVAAIGQVLGNSDAGGASTLSMQVIKNSFTSRETSIVRKFTDIYLAVFKLEKNYTKEQILEFYVNNHLMGGNVYGVSQAAKVYFNKDVGDLNLSEAAILAGMFQSPNLYKPTNEQNIEAVTRRRNTVLYLMERHGYITKEEREIASSIDIADLVNYNEEASSGISEWQGYIDTVVSEVEENWDVNPYNGGLDIYTNLDTDKQRALNDVMNGTTYSWVNDVIQSGVTVLDSDTGAILAVGAGRNKTAANTLNFATSEDIRRQPGSTAKPLFDYGPLIEYNNASTYGYNDDGSYRLFVDEPYSYSSGQAINNWDGTFMGAISIRRALSLSRNIPALKAFQQVDKSKIIEFVTGLGIEPEIENNTIHEAHALGAFTGVNSLDMAAAYAAFSNGGYYNEPYAVQKIVYRDSGEEEEHEAVRRQVMSDATAYMITSILDDVTITGGGDMPNVAMKTGTTNFDADTRERLGMSDDAIRDSWVVGYTTDTVIAMWYGYEKTTADLVSQGYYCHNLSGTVQRDRLFTAIANGVFEQDKKEFTMPDSVVRLPIISGSNPAVVAPDGYTGSVVYEYFKKGYEPTSTHSSTSSKLSTPTNLNVTYNNNTVKITWNAVTPSANNNAYGDFGYNVYFNNTLLGFTTNTSYTINNESNPYGTYRVVATYRSYDGMQSDAATFELKKSSSNSLRITAQSINVDSFNINSIKNYVTVYNNDEDVTSNTSNWEIISITDSSNTNYPLTTTTLSTPGTYNLKYRFTYDGETKETQTIRVTITSSTSPTDPDTGGEETGSDPSTP